MTATPALRVYREADADLTLLSDKAIAVVGYGSQGHAHALNLRDFGVGRVIVALRDNAPSGIRAAQAGFEIMPPAEAAALADIVMMLTPDEAQADIYRDHLAHNMKEGAALAFAHGLNIHFGLIKPRPDLDVFLAAPKGPGRMLRGEFEQGRGLPCLIAVHQNATGRAFDLALAYACSIGGGRLAVLETTFREECETDLFGEQAVLCGGISHLIQAGFETLVEAGYSPEMAYFECLHETKLVVDLLYKDGLTGMRKAISNTAEYGDYVSGPRVIDGHVKAAMKNVLADIQSGRFVHNFMGGNKEGLAHLQQMREDHARHPVEDVGARLRALMGLSEK